MESDKKKKIISVAIAIGLILLLLFIFFRPANDPFRDDINRINQASERQIELVSNGLDQGFRIDNAHVVQFTENNQWMLGGLLNGSILRDVFACWLVDDESETVYAVDFIAEEYSEFTFAGDAGYEINMPNEECGILANYLE